MHYLIQNIVPLIVLWVAVFPLSLEAQTDKKSNGLAGWPQENKMMLFDFEEQKLPLELNSFDAEAVQVSHDGSKALQIALKGDVKFSGVTFKPKQAWITKRFKEFSLLFDVTNTSDVSMQLIASIEGKDHQKQVRSRSIPVGVTNTYFFELAGKDLEVDHGMRDDPPAWKTDALHMKIKNLKGFVDYSIISEIRLYVENGSKDKTIVIDNIRLVESPERDPNYLKGLVDEFGQNAKVDFDLKIKTSEELRQLAQKELKSLAVSKPMADRSTYGGWKDGPKLKATGYFRTEKVEGKWSLVDPEGYLFFSTGIANARMSNTTTFTGIDYKNNNIAQTDSLEITPEDSKGMVALTDEMTNTAYVAYPERNAMFIGLPTYKGPLVNHYSYRTKSHMGPVKKGETFSFYQANLERRYGEQFPGSYLGKWRDVTIDRMLDWGFTSFGNWAAPEFYQSKRIPYFANGWIEGDFKTVSSGSDYWGPMPDPFDPLFAERAKASIETIREEVMGNPWCIGVFIDNEKSWGRMGSVKGQYGIVLDALSKNDSESPIKTEFVRLLKEKYGRIGKLNKAWKTKTSSWEAFGAGVDYKNKKAFSDAMVGDLSMLLEAFGTEYFKIVHDLLEEHMPNFMYMGCRFASWGMSPEVRKAALKYVDVFSYNFYNEALGNNYWKFLEEMDKPSIIGEYHMGALDSGFFNAGVVHAADQKDRARMWKSYTESVIDNPYFVGAHWFQYVDSPVTGRAHDGENYNIGFVTNTDIPYPHMVKAAKELNSKLYQRRFGKK